MLTCVILSVSGVGGNCVGLGESGEMEMLEMDGEMRKVGIGAEKLTWQDWVQRGEMARKLASKST